MEANEKYEDYLYELEYSAGTIAQYMTAVAQYAAFAGTDKPDKTALLRWKRRLTETKRPATVNLRIAAINRWCRFMNADIELKPLKLQRRTTVENVITVDDYHKLIDGLERDGKTRWAAFYKLLGQTGVRVSELLNIRRSDLVRFCFLGDTISFAAVMLPLPLKQAFAFIAKQTKNDFKEDFSK